MRRTVPVITACIMLILVAVSVSADTREKSVWYPLYMSRWNDTYSPSTEPVVPLAHAKESFERSYRACAVVVGDGEMLLAFGGKGDGVEFHYQVPDDLCVYAYIPDGGGGLHANHLDLYLFQRGKQKAALMRPEIKMSSSPFAP